MPNTTPTPQQTQEIFETLQARFEQNMNRHKSLNWDKIQEKLEANPKKLLSLYEMENTGGQPDVVGFDEQTSEYIFYDCSAETPLQRRSLCYDNEALESRKANKPVDSAVNMAKNMGAKILNKEEYEFLQSLGNFDTKTSTWIETPKNIRALGGALFVDFRYNTVFVYHNGAESYYGVRGFRASLRV